MSHKPGRRPTEGWSAKFELAWAQRCRKNPCVFRRGICIHCGADKIRINENEKDTGKIS